MSPQKWNRLQLSDSLTYKLRNLKGRTGLTPNLICRLGFCMSLAEPRIPDPSVFDEEGPEFNRSTLFGEWDDLFEAFLRERLESDGLAVEEHFLPQLRAHLNRGAEMACSRIRDLPDVLSLVPNNVNA